MPPSRHGRRRALPHDHSRRRAAARPQAPSPRPAWLPGASAFAAVVMLAAGIPAAHAGLIAAGTVTAAQPAAVEAAPAIAAQAQAVITYPRTEVGTRPADLPAPAAPAATGAAAVTPAAAAAAPPTAVPVDSTLGAPLASMSISSPFGFRTSPITGGSGELHTGLDLVASCQTAVFSAGSGTVVEAGWSQNGGGNRIVVDHGNGMKSTYNHLSSIEVSVGAVVAKGQRLGGAGTTGNSTGCHLHFEIVRNGVPVDPRGWLRS
ncbi:M23 family metallopeptidase [Pseudarthrobacter cellobiosi]|uniref:M23 family metallopeptidase n=1 Tax=Pseudarthrobacter cellobiosi TaxID=2953654 RepID=UPI00208F239A|nr:peptidoglycan DD-metalloendopeptidase family protein [Pseudarthrobacter sp. HLT1-5]MCO4254500.1 M23 family metallopeptidase [Pseudarthrobacter sp. HLT1-5]